MLNPDVKAKWLAALRSGDYTQTVGFLKDTVGYCCLGVLREVCDITREADVELLDVGAAAAVGLTDEVQTRLATMNDSGKTFVDIADYIESDL